MFYPDPVKGKPTERFFQSTKRLFEKNEYKSLQRSVVGIIGVGGVGSWASSALVRCGVTKLVLVDNDIVVESNINRQCQANYNNLGKAKVFAMKQILNEINPSVVVNTIEEEFTFCNAKEIIENEKVDFWIDACDSIQAKIVLIESLKSGLTPYPPFVICGAAGGKTNPSKICYLDLERTTNDPLLAKLRYDLRRKKGFPRKGKMKVPCISSSESSKKKSTGRLSCAGYGSIVTVTASMGLLAASKAIEKITVSKQK